MNHTLNLKYLTIVIAVLLALLSSCRSRETLTSIPTPMLPSSLTSTITPTLITSHPTSTPTYVSNAKPIITKSGPKSDTKIDTPTLVPKPTKTPITQSIPLSKDGPWIIYLKSYDTPPLLCNLDGSGCFPVNMPIKSWGWYLYNYITAPKGGYLALLALEEEYDPQIWIIKLPERKIIRKIPLLAHEVRDTLPPELDPNYPSFFYSLVDQENVLWSPNGQFLAFVSAQEGPNSDLYLYDVNNDSVRKVSNENKSVHIMGWSPDSHLIVYAHVEDYDVYFANEISIEVADIRSEPKIPYGWSLEINKSKFSKFDCRLDFIFDIYNLS